MIQALWGGCPRILLSSLDHGKILLREQINDNFIALFPLQCRLQHLDEDGELFEVTRLVGDLFDVLLLVLTSPDEPLHLGLNIDDDGALRVKVTDLEH